MNVCIETQCCYQIFVEYCKYHLKQIGTSVASQISNNIYVDNVLLGADSVQDDYEMYLESKDIFKRASMNLRE